MLSDNAKAQIIGVVLFSFAIVLVFLACLLCPCPLQAAVDTCIRRGVGAGAGAKKKPPAANYGCFGDCADEEEGTESQAGSIVGGIRQEPAAPASYPKAWEQKKYEAEPRPYVTLSFSVTRQQDCLIVYLYKADGTPGPRLGLSHNNFAIVQLSEARSQLVLADVKTGVVSNTMAPVFNETLILSLPPETRPEMLSLCIRCLDFDRFSRERVVGEVRVGLPREPDQTIQYNCVLSEPPMSEKGEILVALHYMPTAERVRLMLLKADGLFAPDRRLPSPYVHVALVMGGSTLYKKRTRIYEETSRPVFNELLNIDLPYHSLDKVTLLVSVMNCHLRKRVRPDLDACLGFVIFSSSCYGSGKVHWTEMARLPRTAIAYWHRLS